MDNRVLFYKINTSYIYFEFINILSNILFLLRYHEFQFGSNNWNAYLASVTCFQVSETRDQIINEKF